MAIDSETFYMNVDEKGRPTIPASQRRKLGIENGETLAGRIVDGKLIMMVPDDPFDNLARQAQAELDQDEGTILVEPEHE